MLLELPFPLWCLHISSPSVNPCLWQYFGSKFLPFPLVAEALGTKLTEPWDRALPWQGTVLQLHLCSDSLDQWAGSGAAWNFSQFSVTSLWMISKRIFFYYCYYGSLFWNKILNVHIKIKIKIKKRQSCIFKSSFYWCTVDLQHGVNFCYLAKWFSYTYINIFLFIFFPMMVYYRILNIVPYVIQ